jgi:hypothetical protein
LGSAGERGVAAADRGHTSLGLLPVLLAAEGGQVEQAVGKDEMVGAAAVGRVGVEDLIAFAQEAAVARQFGFGDTTNRPAGNRRSDARENPDDDGVWTTVVWTAADREDRPANTSPRR